MQGFLDQVKKMAEEVTTKQGCRLYDVEFVGAPGGRALRIYIDKEDAGGASIDDCSKVSRGLNEILEANEEIIPGGNYNLEVSTPGLERVLREHWHFEAVIGRKISVKTFAALLDFNPEVQALGKAKTIIGTLTSVDDKEFRLSWSDDKGGEHAVVVPRDQVTKAHKVFEFVEPTKTKPVHPKAHKGSQGAAKK